MAEPPTASQEAYTIALANDRPTIDAAVKSFMSLVAARAATSQQSDSIDALQQARLLLKAINNFTFPLKADPSDDYKVVSQVWNGLIASQQKPSKYLGRMALLEAWKNGLPDEMDEEGTEFGTEFGSLLLQYDATNVPSQDSDTCLVWDTDKGQAELARRRQRRADRAREAQEQTATPFIEELPDEEENTNDE